MQPEQPKFDPYHKWLGIPPKDQPPNHYRLLALELFESDPEVIDAAANRLMTFVHDHSRGAHAVESKKLQAEISAAHKCLHDPRQKAAYDARLKTLGAGVANGTATTGNDPRVAARSAAAAAHAPPSVKSAAPPKAPPKKVLRAQPLAKTDEPSEPDDEPVPPAQDEAFADFESAVGQVEATTHGHAKKSRKSPRGRSNPPAWLIPAILAGCVLALVGIGVLVAMNWQPPEGVAQKPDKKPKTDRGADPAKATAAGDKTAKPKQPDKSAGGKASGDLLAGARQPKENGDLLNEDDPNVDPDTGLAPAPRTDTPGPKSVNPATTPINPATRPAEPGGQTGDNKLFDLIARQGKISDLRALLAEGAEIEGRDATGRTPLRMAAIGGRYELAEELILNKANVNAADSRGETPLMSAAQNGDAKMAQLLLKNGADPNAKTVSGANEPGGGLTALLVAARKGHADVIELLLLNRADIEAANPEGVTPLMVAAWQGHLNAVRALLLKDAKFTSADNEGQTPLMYAVEGGNVEVVKAILEKGAQANIPRNDGSTPLAIALGKKNPAMIVAIREAVKDSSPFFIEDY